MAKTNQEKLIEVQAKIAKKKAELKKLQDTEQNLKLVVENEKLKRALSDVRKQQEIPQVRPAAVDTSASNTAVINPR